ncbi:EamA family transporter [Qaidamihabitans albus]|uniref:EamA family transporter n=1 Tax=Qaidamihabitans albus TaxID=2795733 RepID=UPI0018F1E1D8|nr:EamA family transporter [Qaidamihabitans albus]
MPPWTFVLGSVISVQFGQSFGKQLSGEAGPLGVAALRLTVAALVLLAVHRPALPRPRSGLGSILGLGTAIAGMNLIYPALAHLPLGMAATLQLLGPITLALLSSRRPVDAALAALAGSGVWLFHGTGAGTPLGVLLALASGAAMAIYLLLSERAGRLSETSAPLTFAVCWAAALYLPFGIAEGGAALLDPGVLLAGAAVAVLSAVIPYSLDLAALRRLPPRVVGVLESLEPAAAGLAGTVVLAELLRPVEWIAIACVCAASAGAVITHSGRSGPRFGVC